MTKSSGPTSCRRGVGWSGVGAAGELGDGVADGRNADGLSATRGFREAASVGVLNCRGSEDESSSGFEFQNFGFAGVENSGGVGAGRATFQAHRVITMVAGHGDVHAFVVEVVK